MCVQRRPRGGERGGQAAYLIEHPGDAPLAFFRSTPPPMYWPVVLWTFAASVIASQALISGAFTLINNAVVLGLFPLVRVRHTNAKHYLQARRSGTASPRRMRKHTRKGGGGGPQRCTRRR